MISERTQELIDEFQQCSRWFSNIGEPPGYDSVVQADSLDDAIRMFHSDDWADTCLEASNGLVMRLDQDFPERFQGIWNELIDEVDRLIIPVVDPLALGFIEEHAEIPNVRQTFRLIRDPDEPDPQPHECMLFRQRLLSTTRMACMEAEYSDIIPLAFFSEISVWYLAGHLPCGLTEEYPKGKLIVF